MVLVWVKTALPGEESGRNFSTSRVLGCLHVFAQQAQQDHGSLHVPIEHHPTIRYMVYNGYYKVMSNIPKMGHLPTPEDIKINQKAP